MILNRLNDFSRKQEDMTNHQKLSAAKNKLFHKMHHNEEHSQSQHFVPFSLLFFFF